MSLVEQDTIEYASTAYFEFIIKSEIISSHLYSMQYFFAPENMPVKVAHNWPNFFSILPTRINPAKILISVP